MRKIIIFFVGLYTTIGMTQELKATLLSNSEVELEISNPDELWFFIPTSSNEVPFSLETKEKGVNYALNFFFIKENGLDDCNFSFTHYDYPKDRKEVMYSFGFSGFFSRERNIKFRFSYNYQPYLGDDCKNEEQLYIAFGILQEGIHKSKFLKRKATEFFKTHEERIFFEGELISNKVLLKC